MKITFYKSAVNSYGEIYQASLMTITFPPGTSEQQAVVAATKQFEEEMKLKHWQELAHTYEVS